uniref:HpcH/HpaI aldolase/citrate lyase domain-containing protein n=2 Tax=Clastoptera arizonana TaxID=38151 RepID=A0A1B6CKA0_9HEMI
MTIFIRLNLLIRPNRSRLLQFCTEHSFHEKKIEMANVNDDSLRRAMMYCPGNDLRKIKKALSSNADCIVLDCEDGVAVNKKKDARETIRNIFKEGNIPTRPEVCVRVNSVGSGICEDDLIAILTAGNLPKTILLPKVESEEQLIWEQLEALMDKNYYTLDKNLYL